MAGRPQPPGHRSLLSINIVNIINFVNVVNGDVLVTYPELVTVSSKRETRSSVLSSALGAYKMLSKTHSGRPVWQSTERHDRYLLYNGITKWFSWCVTTQLREMFGVGSQQGSLRCGFYNAE